jgi:NAD/NADP transhydrogenase alpha subunit
MVASMKDGSVVVDLAAEQGGNCELTEKDQVVVLSLNKSLCSRIRILKTE